MPDPAAQNSTFAGVYHNCSSVPMKTDQMKFTEFDLPCAAEGQQGGSYAEGQRLFFPGVPLKSSDRHVINGNIQSSNEMPPDSTSFREDSAIAGGVTRVKRNSESSASSSSDHPSDNALGDTSSQYEACEKELEGMSEPVSHFHMTRVDWRWAAKKGFWDKEKKCWIESAGGKAAYIAQRSKRIMIREQRVSRRQKAAHPKPAASTLRSGIREELAYNANNDPWKEYMFSSPGVAVPYSAGSYSVAPEANPGRSGSMGNSTFGCGVGGVWTGPAAGEDPRPGMAESWWGPAPPREAEPPRWADGSASADPAHPSGFHGAGGHEPPADFAAPSFPGWRADAWQDPTPDSWGEGPAQRRQRAASWAGPAGVPPSARQATAEGLGNWWDGAWAHGGADGRGSGTMPRGSGRDDGPGCEWGGDAAGPACGGGGVWAGPGGGISQQAAVAQHGWGRTVGGGGGGGGGGGVGGSYCGGGGGGAGGLAPLNGGWW